MIISAPRKVLKGAMNLIDEDRAEAVYATRVPRIGARRGQSAAGSVFRQTALPTGGDWIDSISLNVTARERAFTGWPRPTPQAESK